MPASSLLKPRSLLLMTALALLPGACTADTSPGPSTAPATTSAPATKPIIKPAVIPDPMHFDTTAMTIKGKPFSIEVADSTEQEARGLMYRDSLPADHGMLFVMPELKEWSFWMHDTWIPLDIIFLDRRGTVIEIEARQAMDETGMGPKVPAQYIIELNLGMANKIGLKPGDTIEIPAKYAKN